MTDFEQLYNDKRDVVFRYLVKLTGNESLSEELTEEAFYRAYMNYSSLRNKERALSWLCEIAKNVYFAWYNEHKKLTSLGVGEDTADSACIEEAFIQKELSKKALSCYIRRNSNYITQKATDKFCPLPLLFRTASV